MLTVEKIRLEMQETIKAQSKELAIMRIDNKKSLIKIHEETLAIDTLAAEALSSQSFLKEAEAKVQDFASLWLEKPSLEERLSACLSELDQVKS